MAHNPEWHAEYARLETAARQANMATDAAERAMNRKRTPAAKAAAREAYLAALEVSRAAGKARWDFEMSACKIVDIATLPTGQFWSAMRPQR